MDLCSGQYFHTKFEKWRHFRVFAFHFSIPIFSDKRDHDSSTMTIICTGRSDGCTPGIVGGLTLYKRPTIPPVWGFPIHKSNKNKILSIVTKNASVDCAYCYIWLSQSVCIMCKNLRFPSRLLHEARSLMLHG